MAAISTGTYQRAMEDTDTNISLYRDSLAIRPTNSSRLTSF